MNLKSILYVEDEPDIRQIVKLLLSQQGVAVHEYSCGTEALADLPDSTPDLILMDLMMRGIDGIETLTKLRKLENYQKTPCIFFTAKADAYTLKSLKKIANTEVIYKPFKMQNFVSDLENLYLQLQQQD